jgi:hypothetical protein
MTDKINISAKAVAVMLDGVTPGPWKFVPKGMKTIITDAEYDVLFRANGTCAPYYDARFIAWAREAVPALAARLAEVEAERDEWRAAHGYCLADRGIAATRAEAAEAKLAATPSPEALIRAALEEAAKDVEEWAKFAGVKNAPLANSIRALANDPEAVARIAKAAEGRG